MKKVITGFITLNMAVLLISGCAPAQAQPASASPATALPHAPVTATPWPAPLPPKRPIYIVDPNDQGTLSRILVVDPDRRRIAFTIMARFLPEVVLSGDGGRLYVADSYRAQVIRGEQRDVLSVYDALTGELLMDDTPIQGRLLYKAFPDGEPFLFLSDEGRQLYAMMYGEPDVHQLRLTMLDAETLHILHEGNWPPCDYRIQVRSDRWLCANTGPSALTIDTVDPARAVVVETQMMFPGLRVAGLALAADGHRLYVFSPDAAVTVIDVQRRVILATSRLATKAGWEVVWGSAVLSPDGRQLYVGFDTGDDAYQVFTDAIAVYEVATWENIATIELRDRVMSFALSVEGDRLYAVSPFAQSLVIYDTATYREVAVMTDLSGTPARIVVPDTQHR